MCSAEGPSRHDCQEVKLCITWISINFICLNIYKPVRGCMSLSKSISKHFSIKGKTMWIKLIWINLIFWPILSKPNMDQFFHFNKYWASEWDDGFHIYGGSFQQWELCCSGWKVQYGYKRGNPLSLTIVPKKLRPFRFLAPPPQ